ncbi:MAG: DMT family transporter [Pseudomonadota bacterium]
MRLILLTSFTMCAFAANSILTRVAIEPGYIDAMSFALIRVLAGAAFLSVFVWSRGKALPLFDHARVLGAFSLAAYMIGFSLAYITLDAGLGALILFGTVQIAMFSQSAITGRRPTLRQLSGASIAFVGLLIALWPAGGSNTDAHLFGVALMVLAGIGWAAYTISGRSASDPLAATAANFVICLPILCLTLFAFLDHATLIGIALAIVCGAVTSGLGYALWYRVLAHLQPSSAAVVQLSVPILAILAGSLLLGETLTFAIGIAAVLVVFGIGLSVTTRSLRADRT